MPCGRFGGACAPFAPLGSGTAAYRFLIGSDYSLTTSKIIVFI